MQEQRKNDDRPDAKAVDCAQRKKIKLQKIIDRLQKKNSAPYQAAATGIGPIEGEPEHPVEWQPKWIGLKAARFLLRKDGVEPHPQTVKRWARRHGIGHKPAGCQWKFDEMRILAWNDDRVFPKLGPCEVL